MILQVPTPPATTVLGILQARVSSSRPALRTLAMARTGQPHSATSQFFVNTVDNAFLDRANSKDGFGYAVFGRVTEGMDVVDKIRSVRTTDAGGQENVPVQDVIIKSIRRVDAK